MSDQKAAASDTHLTYGVSDDIRQNNDLDGTDQYGDSKSDGNGTSAQNTSCLEGRSTDAVRHTQRLSSSKRPRLLDIDDDDDDDGDFSLSALALPKGK